MLFINHKVDGKIAVADTDDEVIELITQNEYNRYIQSGVEIKSWAEACNFITASMNNKCNYKLYKKLCRGTTASELLGYLEQHSVYTITSFLNKTNLTIRFDRECKLFPYNDTCGFFSFILQLSDNSLLIVKSNSDNSCYVQHLERDYHLEQYPSSSGRNIINLGMRAGVVFDNIDPDGIYLLFYSNKHNEILLINQNNIGKPNNMLLFSVRQGTKLA